MNRSIRLIPQSLVPLPYLLLFKIRGVDIDSSRSCRSWFSLAQHKFLKSSYIYRNVDLDLVEIHLF